MSTKRRMRGARKTNKSNTQNFAMPDVIKDLTSPKTLKTSIVNAPSNVAWAIKELSNKLLKPHASPKRRRMSR